MNALADFCAVVTAVILVAALAYVAVRGWDRIVRATGIWIRRNRRHAYVEYPRRWPTLGG